ncbi:MAG: ISKra4 family transposase [Okeania sp. SIO2D1]|nr:ISKra4 family transposase [Okeania sp. SIO2D1]
MLTPTVTSIEQKVFNSAKEQYELLESKLSTQEYQSVEHGEVESWLFKAGTELLRRLLQGYLDLRYQKEEAQKEVYGSDGQKRPHRRNRCERKIESLFGEVVVTRLGYTSKEAGVSGLYPEDGKLNLAEDKYSDGVRKRVAIEASRVSFTETSESIKHTTGASVGKRQCEELIVKVAQDFEDFYRQKNNDKPESTENLLVLTTDGKGIVMHQDDLREATAKEAKKSSSKSKARLSPGEKRNRKRMATVASVYSVPRYSRTPKQIMNRELSQPQRPAISNKRVWASVKQDSSSVIQDAFAEAHNRDPMQQREWVVLVDGQEHQLKSIKAQAKRDSVKVSIVLDFIHVLEYLWKAAFCFHVSGSEAVENWVSERALRILQGKASDVAAGIRRSATLQNLSSVERQNADKCADYLLKYRQYLCYDEYLQKGYPIATGVIEGACRHLVNDRMAITGARWRLDRAEAVLQIRALTTSGHFDEYWKFHKIAEFERHHVSQFLEPERLLALAS